MEKNVGVGVGPAERAQDAGGAGPTPEPRRRMSARRKQEAVLRRLRGEDLELLSRELVVTAAEPRGSARRRQALHRRAGAGRSGNRATCDQVDPRHDDDESACVWRARALARSPQPQDHFA